MLRDAETTSIAERMRRSPVGGNALSRRRGGGLASFFLLYDFVLAVFISYSHHSRLWAESGVGLGGDKRDFAKAEPDVCSTCFSLSPSESPTPLHFFQVHNVLEPASPDLCDFVAVVAPTSRVSPSNSGTAPESASRPILPPSPPSPLSTSEAAPD